MNVVDGVTRSRTFEVLKGWVTFLAVLLFLGAITVLVWQAVGGGINFLASMLAVAAVVVLYSFRNFG